MKSMPFLVFLFLSLGVISASTQAESEHVVIGGGGYSEELVLLSLRNFDRAAQICENQDHFLCSLSAEDTAAIATIRSHMPALLNDPAYIEFKSEDDAPEVFPAGENIKFFTERVPGSHVLINRTMLYRQNGAGLDLPISIIDAFTLVTQVLIYQMTQMSELNTFQLGLRLGHVAAARTNELEIGRASDSFRIFDPKKRVRFLDLQMEGPDNGFNPSVFLIQDTEGMTDASEEIREQLDCGSSEVAAFSLDRLSVISVTYNLSELKTKLKTTVRYTCADDPLRLFAENISLSSSFSELLVEQPRSLEDRAFSYQPGSLLVLIIP